MTTAQYRISELAEKAGVTRRTIHYYMARGLLPASEGTGLGTTYSDEHLYRIILIKKLQDAYLPLDEIRKKLMLMSLEDVRCALNEDISTEAKEALQEPAVRIGVTYERIPVGNGVEIHFPSGNKKAADIASALHDYAIKLMKER